MIPNEELDLLTNTLFRAMDLAGNQLCADGPCEWVYGLRRVEAVRCEARETGTDAPWMAELEARWRLAIGRNCEEYGMRGRR